LFDGLTEKKEKKKIKKKSKEERLKYTTIKYIQKRKKYIERKNKKTKK